MSAGFENQFFWKMGIILMQSIEVVIFRLKLVVRYFKFLALGVRISVAIYRCFRQLKTNINPLLSFRTHYNHKSVCVVWF